MYNIEQVLSHNLCPLDTDTGCEISIACLPSLTWSLSDFHIRYKYYLIKELYICLGDTFTLNSSSLYLNGKFISLSLMLMFLINMGDMLRHAEYSRWLGKWRYYVASKCASLICFFCSCDFLIFVFNTGQWMAKSRTSWRHTSESLFDRIERSSGLQEVPPFSWAHIDIISIINLYGIIISQDRIHLYVRLDNHWETYIWWVD